MKPSPQQISPNSSATTSATWPRAVKTLSLFLAVVMLCATTTFITARIAHRQARQIAGDFVLPIASGKQVIKGDAVLGIHPRSKTTSDPTVTHSHLDPHRRLPAAAEPARVAARAVPHQQVRYGQGRQDRQGSGGDRVVTIAR